MYRFSFLFIYLLLVDICFSQNSKDPSIIKKDTLQSVVVESQKENDFGLTRLKQVEGTAIYAGKKTEVILLNDASANLATNNARQIYSKVAGLNIWESDGSGIQLGIGGRGLNPNRVSNFNTRQNGYDISADALGYPESYYTPPAEALERIEVVRGAASLQYGTQFGGIINFRFKQPELGKLFQVEAKQTIGSFNLYNTFLMLNGNKNKFSYSAFYQRKAGDGWRKNSSFNAQTAFVSVGFDITQKLKVSAEYTFMNYLAQQAGGLTDKQFIKDPQQSIRDRNWFQVNWNLAAIIADYEISETSKLNMRIFGLYAKRDALGFLGVINRVDPLTERDLLKDVYQNYGAELRFLKQYNFLKKASTFLIGGRYYNGTTFRKQGLGSSAYDADFSYLNPNDLEHSNYVFPSENISFFSENVFRISSKWNLTPGVRFEYISTKSDGYYNEQYKDLAGNIIFKSQNYDSKSSYRHFVLFGLGTGYKLSTTTELYANFSQNYRSINFNDMRIVNPNMRVDLNLKDETGYSSDIGFRGTLKNYLSFDFSLFYLKYNNRIGTVLLVDSFTYQPYRFRTNISDSRNIGIESFVELDVYKLFAGSYRKTSVSLFANVSLIDAKYIDSKQNAYKDKEVEYVPRLIIRTGISYSYKKLKTTIQYSKTGQQFSDATNSEYSSNAVTGIIPEYDIVDFSISYSYKWIVCSAGINNLMDNRYFTRRADGYPGPGIIPADGRSFYLTLGVKF